MEIEQGFPQVLRTRGGALQNLMGRALVNIWGSMGGLKMQSKYNCEGVHLIIKMPAVSLQIY